LREAAEYGDAVPAFDVCLLGVGEDAHVASLFPGRPAMYETERTVVSVHGSPKPPPARISLTLPAIRAAREGWLIASGEAAAKASAIRLAWATRGPSEVPAAGARRRARTLCRLGRAAASALPPGFCVPGVV